MKIGIIVHSQTGNTLSVAQKLKEKLAAAGHSVNIERISPVGGDQKRPVQIEKLPDLSVYDALVFAAPVQAFSLSPVMKAYLGQLPSLSNKKVACFVTKAFPFNWTGGNNAISHLKKGVGSKGGNIIGTSIIHSSDKIREKETADMLEKFSKLF